MALHKVVCLLAFQNLEDLGNVQALAPQRSKFSLSSQQVTTTPGNLTGDTVGSHTGGVVGNVIGILYEQLQDLDGSVTGRISR